MNRKTQEPNPDAALQRAISEAGGHSALGRRLDVSREVVAQWVRRRRVPAERVLSIERETGVPRHELRPDLYPFE